MKVRLLIGILCFVLVACGAPLTQKKHVMVEGTVMEMKAFDGELQFAFSTKDGLVFDNYGKELNYSIQINNELSHPTIRYRQLYRITTEKGKEVKREPVSEKEYIHPAGFLDEGTPIEIEMSKETYYAIFGKSGNI